MFGRSSPYLHQFIIFNKMKKLAEYTYTWSRNIFTIISGSCCAKMLLHLYTVLFIIEEGSSSWKSFRCYHMTNLYSRYAAIISCEFTGGSCTQMALESVNSKFLLLSSESNLHRGTVWSHSFRLTTAWRQGGVSTPAIWMFQHKDRYYLLH